MIRRYSGGNQPLPCALRRSNEESTTVGAHQDRLKHRGKLSGNATIGCDEERSVVLIPHSDARSMGEERTEEGKTLGSDDFFEDYIEPPSRSDEKSSPDDGCEEARRREALNEEISRAIVTKEPWRH